MRSFRPLIVAVSLLPFVGGDVAWAFALEVLADETHHVALHASGGRLDIVLHHDSDGDHHHHSDRAHHGATLGSRSIQEDGHRVSSHHADHVVRLTRTERLAPTAQSRALVRTVAMLAPPVDQLIVGAAAVTSCLASARCGPTAHSSSRSSVLRL